MATRIEAVETEFRAVSAALLAERAAAEAGPDGSPFSLFPLTVLMFGAQRAKDE